jgi:hypothetical protein
MTKARQLADLIDPRNEKEPHWRDLESAAEELRRLSDENHMIRLQRAEFLSRKQELEEALTVVLELIGGVNE